jgi:hypothetical protein
MPMVGGAALLCESVLVVLIFTRTPAILLRSVNHHRLRRSERRFLVCAGLARFLIRGWELSTFLILGSLLRLGIRVSLLAKNASSRAGLAFELDAVEVVLCNGFGLIFRQKLLDLVDFLGSVNVAVFIT